jgi:Fic family protein
LSEADRALGFLYGQIAAREGARHLLGMACRREAVASCRLDGSTIDLADLLWWELDGARADRLRVSRGEARICQNYAALLGSMADTAAPESDQEWLTGKRLCAAHAALFKGLRGRDERAGCLRDSVIWLGPPGSTVATAHFVPPAPDTLPRHLDDLRSFARSDVALPTLAKVALIYHRLDTLHPFVDGSGRLSRLTLMHLLRTAHGPWPQLLVPSARMADDFSEHFQQQQRVREHGDWDGWVLYFARSLRDAAESSLVVVESMESVLQEHEAQIRRHLPSLSATATRLLQRLPSQPLISVSDVASICQRTFANANTLVSRLQATGILKEVTGRRRHRRYLYAAYGELE